MEINVFNHGRSCHADGVYTNGSVVVTKGSKINTDCKNKFGRYAEAFAMRKDPTIVDKNGVTIKDCRFNTPSAAAVFVAGSSRNGNDFWKVSEGVSLGAYFEKEGIRERKRRSK